MDIARQRNNLPATGSMCSTHVDLGCVHGARSETIGLNAAVQRGGVCPSRPARRLSRRGARRAPHCTRRARRKRLAPPKKTNTHTHTKKKSLIVLLCFLWFCFVFLLLFFWGGGRLLRIRSSLLGHVCGKGSLGPKGFSQSLCTILYNRTLSNNT